MTAIEDHARSIFLDALERAPDEWPAFLDQACGDNAELRARVDQLLHAHQAMGSIHGGDADAPVATLDKPEITERPGTVIGPYKLLQEIGEGGMGTVFMAEQTHPVQRKVALKIIKPGMDSRQVIARFEVERQALALMDHPNIAKVLDAGTTGENPKSEARNPKQIQRTKSESQNAHDSAVSNIAASNLDIVSDFGFRASDFPSSGGCPYFVMELVKGIPITKYCDDNHLTPRERLEPFIPACHAVQHAHQKGIIHRDLKPSNVLVALYDGRPVPKVIDFGVAKATSQKLTERTMFTQFGQIVGTLEYMSPEQADLNQFDIDTRSDIYSLGVLLYELLTGTTPFERKRLREAAFDELLRIIREEEPPKPSTRLSTTDELPSIAAKRKTEPRKLSGLLRGELDWIVMKALEKDRNRRYESASAIVMDVQRYLSDEPVHACPPSVAYRLRKFARRNKGVFTAAALLLVVLALATMISTSQAIRAQLARNDEAEQRKKAERAQADAEATYRAMEIALTDLHTSHGVMAGEQGEPALAALWFATAVRLARNDPEREHTNRIRLRNWSREAIVPVRALAHSGQPLTLMAFHSAGQHLMTLSKQNKCVVWDLAEEQPLPWARGDQAVSCAAWSPDGRWLAWGTPAGEVEIYLFPDGKLCHRLVHHGPVQSLAFSPDGRYLALASDGVRIWDCQAERFTTIELAHPHAVLGLVFNQRSDRLATTCQDGQARVFAISAASAEVKPLFPPVPHRFPQPTGISVINPLWLNDGDTLLTLADVTLLHWYDAQTGKLIRALPAGGLRVGSLALSPDGKYFAYGTRAGARLREASTGSPVGSVLPHEHGDVLSTAFSPDGANLLTGSLDATVGLWSLPSGKAVQKPLVHASLVTLVAFAPNGQFIATGQEDGLVRIWRLPQLDAEVRRIHLGGTSWHARLSLHDGRVAVSGYSSTQVYDIATGKPAGPVLAPGGQVIHLELAPDGRTMAMATDSLAGANSEAVWLRPSAGGTLQFWEWQSGKRILDPLPLPSQPHALAYSPAGKHVVVICKDGQVLLVDSARGQIAMRLEHKRERKAGTAAESFRSATGEDWYLAGVQFVTDGRRFMTYGLDATVRVWETATGKLRYPPLRHQELLPVSDCVAVSPEGRLLLTGSNDYTARLWDLESGLPVAQPLLHPGMVFAVCFSPDGKQVVTGCADGMARLWDWRTGQLVCAPFKHGTGVHGVAFTRDGRWVLTASLDETVRLWDWQTGKPITPPLHAGGRCGSLSLTSDGSFALTRVLEAGIAIVPLSDLVEPAELSADDLCLYTELHSRERIHQSDLERLTTDQWLDRWRMFRQRRPHYLTTTPGASSPLHSQNVTAQLDFAQACFIRGDLDQAVAAWRQVIRLQPDYIDAHVMLGFALSRKGAVGEAITAYQAALGLKPDDGRTLNTLAWLLATGPDAKLRDPKQAVELAQRAVAMTPNEGSYCNTLGVAYYRTGQWKDAIEALQKSEQLSPGDSFGSNAFFLGLAHWQLGQKDEARQWYDQAVAWMEKNNPNDEELKRLRDEAAELLEVKKERD